MTPNSNDANVIDGSNDDDNYLQLLQNALENSDSKNINKYKARALVPGTWYHIKRGASSKKYFWLGPCAQKYAYEIILDHEKMKVRVNESPDYSMFILGWVLISPFLIAADKKKVKKVVGNIFPGYTLWDGCEN